MILKLPPDEFAHDPFFKRGPDSEWNACIGSQGDEHNYVDGYMQAALELVEIVIERESWGQRDTLVLPMLYNARHAIELVQKFSARRLLAGGLIRGPVNPHHQVDALWAMLSEAGLGDKVLRETIAALKPFVDSMAAIDEDGQELRYHTNIDDKQSLADRHIVSLEVIRDSLKVLAPLVETLQWRTMKFLDERETGTCTSRCSRSDIFTIARMMPPMDRWKEQAFDDAKVKVRADFGLSSNDFQKVVRIIKEHPELRALLGAETPLKHLTDDLIIASVKEWRKWHPPRDPNEKKSATASEIVKEILSEKTNVRGEVISAIDQMLTPEQFGELAALFYLSRDGTYSESFYAQARRWTPEYSVEERPSPEIYQLFSKTNFLRQLALSTAQIGRLTLAKTLSTM